MMKPLPSAPLTPEDFAIFARPTSDLWLAFKRGVLVASYLKADRRDAELMNWAQTIRYRMTWALDDQVYADQENVRHFGGDITRFV